MRLERIKYLHDTEQTNKKIEQHSKGKKELEKSIKPKEDPEEDDSEVEIEGGGSKKKDDELQDSSEVKKSPVFRKNTISVSESEDEDSKEVGEGNCQWQGR